jgi:hypothetical protein
MALLARRDVQNGCHHRQLRVTSREAAAFLFEVSSNPVFPKVTRRTTGSKSAAF